MAAPPVEDPLLVEGGVGLEGAVAFVSGVTDERIVELYAEAEVAVVPSLYEGFSLPAAEAMACGVPVLATTGGALPEVVGPDGESAGTVEPGDPSALAAMIRARCVGCLRTLDELRCWGKADATAKRHIWQQIQQRCGPAS